MTFISDLKKFAAHGHCSTWGGDYLGSFFLRVNIYYKFIDDEKWWCSWLCAGNNSILNIYM